MNHVRLDMKLWRPTHSHPRLYIYIEGCPQPFPCAVRVRIAFLFSNCPSRLPEFGRDPPAARAMTDLKFPDEVGWTVMVETTFDGCRDPSGEDEDSPEQAEAEDSLSSSNSSDLSSEEDMNDPKVRDAMERCAFSLSLRGR